MDGVGALLELVRRQPGAGCPGCPMGLAPWAVDELLCWEPRAEGGCPRGSGFSEAARWAAGGHGAYAAPREVEGAPRVPGRPQPRGPTLLSGVAPCRVGWPGQTAPAPPRVLSRPAPRAEMEVWARLFVF